MGIEILEVHFYWYKGFLNQHCQGDRNSKPAFWDLGENEQVIRKILIHHTPWEGK